ncbi:type 1 fimbrial protein [Klebsiella variicola]
MTMKIESLMKSVILSALLSTGGMAADVMINVTGKVVTSPCMVDNSGIYNIDLGQNISTATLNPANSYSPWKKFNVTLSNCPAGTTKVTAVFSGTVDGNNNTMYANATGEGYAQNIAIQLQDSTAGMNVGNGATMTVNVVNSAATFPLQARAFSTLGGATSGYISASVLINMTYN